MVLPFRDIFTSFFFISVGMLVDVRANFRADGYQMHRSRRTIRGTLPDLVRHIPATIITSFTDEPGSPLTGTTFGGFNLNKR